VAPGESDPDQSAVGERAEARLRAASERLALTRAFGAKLRSMSKTAGLSTRELAERCGIAPYTLTKIELGKREPSLSYILFICEGLNVTANELLDGLPTPQTRSKP
jgi:DNA-binding XRE family transcriptional regulator